MTAAIAGALFTQKPVAIETVNKVLALTQRQATIDREDGTGDESILPIKGHSGMPPGFDTGAPAK